MTNPKQIPEEEINRRVAEALGCINPKPFLNPDDDVRLYIYENGWVATEICPLENKAQLCRLLMDNWEGIVRILEEWFFEAEKYVPWEVCPGFLSNKELWILRALVAYKEGLGKDERPQVKS